MQGKIAKIIFDRGFGFIDGDDQKRYFVHHSQAETFDALGVGDRVNFEVEESEKGPRAVRVTRTAEPVVAATAESNLEV